MNVLFVGLNGFPYEKRAADSRLLAFQKLFSLLNYNVIVINKISSKNVLYKKVDYINDNFEIHNLYDVTNICKYSIIKLFQFIYLYVNEFVKVIILNRKSKIDLIHVYSGHLIELIFYFVISKVIGSKVLYQYVEFRSGIKRKNIYHKLNGFLFDKYFYLFVDGIIVISKFLFDHLILLNHKYKDKLIIIPPIIDFEDFSNLNINNKKNNKYVLYCGSSGYIEVIYFIVDSFLKSDLNKYNYKLKLIINGKQEDKNNLKKIFHKYDFIECIDNLNFLELYLEYYNSDALLIPLRNTIQDIARFPNKISEYVGVKGLIVTTDVGEIKDYFKDNYNALISNDFCVENYAEKLNLLTKLSDDEKQIIKNNAHEVGLKFFNYKSYHTKFCNFLINIK